MLASSSPGSISLPGRIVRRHATPHLPLETRPAAEGVMSRTASVRRVPLSRDVPPVTVGSGISGRWSWFSALFRRGIAFRSRHQQRQQEPMSHAIERLTPKSRSYPRRGNPCIQLAPGRDRSHLLSDQRSVRYPARTNRGERPVMKSPPDRPAPVLVPFETTVSVPRPGTVPSVSSTRTAHPLPFSRFRGW